MDVNASASTLVSLSRLVKDRTFLIKEKCLVVSNLGQQNFDDFSNRGFQTCFKQYYN